MKKNDRIVRIMYQMLVAILVGTTLFVNIPQVVSAEESAIEEPYVIDEPYEPIIVSEPESTPVLTEPEGAIEDDPTNSEPIIVDDSTTDNETEPTQSTDENDSSQMTSEAEAENGEELIQDDSSDRNADLSGEDSAEELGEEDLDYTAEETVDTLDSDAATDRAVDDDGVALHPKGTASSTLRHDDVSESVAEAGYFPSKQMILDGKVPGIFTASMITWHKNNGASCYRIMDTSIFAEAFGGSAAYTPQAGDLIFYQAYRSEYNRGIITSGNSNWLHVGIVAEVGDNYISTIEGNVYQSVSQRTFYTYRYNDGLQDFTKSWIVNVFGDDDDARRAFVNTAWAALSDAETDARYGRSGFNSWRESCYEGVYQNDTIASGYFQVPAAWCEMFVLWCAFHADIQHTGTINIKLYSEGSNILPTIISNYPTLNGYSFEIYEYSEDNQYNDREPISRQETDIAGTLLFSALPYGTYHIQVVEFGAYGPVMEQQCDIVLNEKSLCVLFQLETETRDVTDSPSLLGQIRMTEAPKSLLNTKTIVEYELTGK